MEEEKKVKDTSNQLKSKVFKKQSNPYDFNWDSIIKLGMVSGIIVLMSAGLFYQRETYKLIGSKQTKDPKPEALKPSIVTF